MKDYFVSYNKLDLQWAEWVAWELEDIGLSVVIQAWDFRPGNDFVLEMQKATLETKQTIAILSESYLNAEFTQPEWAQAFANDPLGIMRKLLPVRVSACSPPGLLKSRIYIDLVGKDEEESRKELRKLLAERAKPEFPPSFPIHAQIVARTSRPEFPGRQAIVDKSIRTDNPREKHLADELERARVRKERLGEVGEDLTQISREILNLKRELRRGGQLRPGDQLADRYLLMHQLGRGGYATVWKAYDIQNSCNVAVKALNSSEASSDLSVNRFFRGARVMADLSDIEGVVRVLVPQCEDDGFLYFVMELMTCGNLQEAVIDNRVRTNEAVAILQQILSVLDQTHRHANNCIHRDVKPTNVMLTETAGVKLTDFDLVTTSNTTGGTKTGMLGTFIYAAPEQLTRPQEVDHRADIFGAAMTGIFVLYGDELPVSAWRRPEEFIYGLDAPTKVKSALIQATHESPSDRFDSAMDFLIALREPGGSTELRLASRKGSKALKTRKRRSPTGPFKQEKRYPIPNLTVKQIEYAMETFDREFRNIGRWRAFESNRKHQYAIEFGGKLYPVKLILSLATGLPVIRFSGGDSANRRILNLGFSIIKLTSEGMPNATSNNSSTNLDSDVDTLNSPDR